MTSNRDFHGPNLGYILELYERFQDDPDSVDDSTRKLFQHWKPTSPAESRIRLPLTCSRYPKLPTWPRPSARAVTWPPPSIRWAATPSATHP